MSAINAMKGTDVVSLGWNGDATLYDLKSNISYRIRGSAPRGYNHTDYQVSTRQDCVSKRLAAGLVGNKTNSSNRGDWSWGCRPVILTIKGKESIRIAAATHTFPHGSSVATNAFTIIGGKSNTPPGSGQSWPVGTHFCLHFIDTLSRKYPNIANATNFYKEMNNTVREAYRLGGGVGTIPLPGGSYTNINNVSSDPSLQRVKPPEIIREGTFTLKLELNESQQFQSKFGVPCFAYRVPFIYLPSNFSLGTKRASDLVGYCGFIFNKKLNQSSPIVVAGVSGTGLPSIASVKAGWGVGAEPRVPSKIDTNNITSEFIIALFDDFAPAWSNDIDLVFQVENEVSRRLAGSLSGYNNNSVAMALSGGTMSPQSIDPKLIDKYMVTVDRNTTTLDFKRLKNLGVVGVVIEAGTLFSTSHIKQEKFKSPKFDSQLSGVEAASLDYAFYMNCRAKNLQQAKEEIHEFAYLIRKHPPVLGVWLKVSFSQSTKMNNDIMDIYYKELLDLGLVGKVGLYCSQSELKKIDWVNTHSKKWYWWMIDPIKDTNILNELITPEFFMYERGVGR